MCGHEWEACISKRTDGQGCPECAKEWRISFPEKSIVYYLKKIGLTFEENFHAEWLAEFDLDVYLSDLNVGVSYDGPLHQNRNKESRKNEFCEKNGTFLIRICDSKCVEIDDFYGVCIRRYDNKDTSLNEAIGELLSTLKRLYQIDIPESVSVDVSRDRIGIYELMKMHRKKNSIASQYPDLMEEWHCEKNGSLNPEYILPGSEKKVWWKCKKFGHEWQAIIHSRTRGSNCPICSNNQVLKGFNDLATLLPELAEEWHPSKNEKLTPMDVTKSSGQKVWWLCPKCKYEWKAAVYSRSGNNPNGCPRCEKEKNISSLRIPKQGNSLIERNPVLAEEWHPTKNGELFPNNVSFKSHLKVWWKCKKDHEWEAVVSSRTSGNGCPICYQERRKQGSKEE